MVSARPVQQVLFPADAEEALLFRRCARYQRLGEKAQALVRSQLAMLRDGSQDCKQDWIERAGLARSTGYDVVAREGIEIGAAVVEACQLVGQRAALRGGLALYCAGALLWEGLVSGARTTSSLTAVEYQILVRCAEVAGLLPRLQVAARAQVDAGDGRRMSVSVATTLDNQSDDPALVALLSELQERQRRTPEDAGRGARPESVQPSIGGLVAGEDRRPDGGGAAGIGGSAAAGVGSAASAGAGGPGVGGNGVVDGADQDARAGGGGVEVSVSVVEPGGSEG